MQIKGEGFVSTVAKQQEILYNKPEVGADIYFDIKNNGHKRILRVKEKIGENIFKCEISPRSFPWEDLLNCNFIINIEENTCERVELA